MSRKPVLNSAFHDGSAPNCVNFITVCVDLGQAANLGRTCPHDVCRNEPRSVTTARRRKRKAARP